MMFLSGLFQTPEENFHRSEKVEIDILRSEPHVAIPLPALNAGARHNTATHYTNKGWTPPVYDEETTISAYDKLKRRAGSDPFADNDFLREVVTESFMHMRQLEGKIRRGVELQAAQILQTGALDLRDEVGEVMYAERFNPKPGHFPTVGVAWAADGSTGNPLGDLEALARTVRLNGKSKPEMLIFGATALQRFLANPDVQGKLDNRRFHLGEIAPEVRGEGATFYGWVFIGTYRFEIWTYDDTYIDPQSGTQVPYVGDQKVIMLSRQGRLDLTYGEIPMFERPNARAAQFLPERMSFPERGMDFTTNAWITPDGKHLKLSIGTRALAIPTAIDTFGCLTVL